MGQGMAAMCFGMHMKQLLVNHSETFCYVEG